MWILATIIGILLFFILLLSIPLDLAVRAEGEERWHARVRLRWFFGLVGKDIRSGEDRSRKTEEEQRKPEKPGKPKRKKSRFGFFKDFRMALAAGRIEGFAARFFDYAKDVLGFVRFRELTVRLRAGTGDPMETGLLAGVLMPAVRCANRLSHNCEVRLDPDFERATFSGFLRMRLRVYPAQVLGRTLVFLASPTTFRVLWAVWGARRK